MQRKPNEEAQLVQDKGFNNRMRTSATVLAAAGATAMAMAKSRSGNEGGYSPKKRATRNRFEGTSEPSFSQSALPRPYSADLVPVLSPFRPHCLCSDRLRLWRPILGRGGTNLGWDLTNKQVETIISLMISSYASGTRGVYGSGLLVYHVFCDKNGIPDSLRCPASTPLVLLFVSQCAGFYSGSTLANYVFGVKAWHVVHGQPWSIDDDQTRAALKGAEAKAPPSSKRPKREPFTQAIIEAILNKLDTSAHLDAAVAACLCIAFFAVARLGEVTVTTLVSFDPKKHPTRASVRADQDRHGLRVSVCHLPSTKASPIKGEDIYWSKQTGPWDPEERLKRHVEINPAPLEAHLFAYRHASKWRPLTRKVFVDRIREAAKEAGLPLLQGHGIRIGGTLEHLLRGLPFEVVKVIGRWSSDAFAIYLRKHAVIVAPYIQDHPVLEPFTRYAMPPVR